MNRARKLILLASLYLAQGLPFGFFTQTLPVILRERGLSLTAIGASSLLFLPWALKFLWAPLVDQTGTRRGWILSMQSLTLSAAAMLSLVDPHGGLLYLFIGLVLFNFLSATQDIATDGIAVRLLSPTERGLGNGIQVGAYRVGMIIGGGALLWAYAHFAWSFTFWCMAALLALTCIPALLYLRGGDLSAPLKAAGPARIKPRELLAGWVARLRVAGMPTFLLLVCAYKFGDAMASSLVSPFMYDAGLSKSEIAMVKGTIGSVMGLSGAALGGWLAWKLGRRLALISCGLLQTSSLTLYIACALNPQASLLIYAASTAEHLLGGMATVALFTLMMDAADPDQAGTDYTLMSCAILLAGGVAAVAGGFIGDAFGYVTSFSLACALSGLGCLALVVSIDRGSGPERLATVWTHHLARNVKAELLRR